MNQNDETWQREIERRSKLYDDIDARDAWAGRMGASDYLGLLVLTIALVVGFWIWGH